MTHLQQIPKVSVLLPVYNCEAYIEEAVQSILAQTFKDFEIIAINDGSTDNSLNILRRLQKIDARIKVYTKGNSGVIDTLNFGLKKCQAELVCRMDGDDRMLPDRIRLQYEYMKGHKECAVVGCQLRIFGSDKAKKTDPRPTKPINVAYFLGYGCSISGPTAFARKSALINSGGFSDTAKSAEDYDMWSRIELGLSGHVLANLKETLLEYRMNKKGISHTTRFQQYMTTVAVGDEYRKKWVYRHRIVVTLRQHLGWLRDRGHLDDNDAEDMMRIYYTVTSWYINDLRERHPLIAKFNSAKLRFYTRLLNSKDRHYIGGVGDRHSPPVSGGDNCED